MEVHKEITPCLKGHTFCDMGQGRPIYSYTSMHPFVHAISEQVSETLSHLSRLYVCHFKGHLY